MNLFSEFNNSSYFYFKMSNITNSRMELSSDFGYVYFAVTYAVIMNFYLSSNVMWARKKFDVKYPAMYSDKDPTFNCYQVSLDKIIHLFILVEIALKIVKICILKHVFFHLQNPARICVVLHAENLAFNFGSSLFEF
jgi:hypothetical protein